MLVLLMLFLRACACRPRVWCAVLTDRSFAQTSGLPPPKKFSAEYWHWPQCFVNWGPEGRSSSFFGCSAQFPTMQSSGYFVFTDTLILILAQKCSSYTIAFMITEYMFAKGAKGALGTTGAVPKSRPWKLCSCRSWAAWHVGGAQMVK